MIELRQITFDDFSQCIKLELAEGQQTFVAPNIYTLAEAYVALTTDHFHPMPYAIYSDGELVGMIAMCYQRGTAEMGHYEMYRFMIDKRHQGKGYGRAALSQAIALLRSQPHGPGSHIATSFVPGNDVAKDLYLSLGFVETGEVEDDELVARLEL